MDNYALYALDYLLQTKETSGKYDITRARAHLYDWRNVMTKEDYLATYELMNRIVAQDAKS